MYYVDTRRRDWDTVAFYAEGRAEALRLLRPALELLEFEPSGKRLLEIGCGLGRLFPGHAELFGEVWGVDVSPETIRRGEELCPTRGARFMLGDGQSLAGIEHDTVDYVFSYLVFHHLPKVDLVRSYFAEIRRVLTPGGCFQIQLLARRPLGAMLVRTLPPIRSRWEQSRQIPGDARTWLGVTIRRRDAISYGRGAGLADLTTLAVGDAAPSAYWLLGKKPLASVARSKERRFRDRRDRKRDTPRSMGLA
jgi:SAM-dependent methyltransferase